MLESWYGISLNNFEKYEKTKLVFSTMKILMRNVIQWGFFHE